MYITTSVDSSTWGRTAIESVFSLSGYCRITPDHKGPPTNSLTPFRPAPYTCGLQLGRGFHTEQIPAIYDSQVAGQPAITATTGRNDDRGC